MNCSQVHRPAVILHWQKVPQVPFLHCFLLRDSRMGCYVQEASQKPQPTEHQASMLRPECSEQGPALQTNTTTSHTSLLLPCCIPSSAISCPSAATAPPPPSTGPQHCLYDALRLPQEVTRLLCFTPHFSSTLTSMFQPCYHLLLGFPPPQSSFRHCGTIWACRAAAGIHSEIHRDARRAEVWPHTPPG